MKIKTTILVFLSVFYLGLNSSSAQNQHNDNKRIQSLIKKKKAYNKKHGFGFRIQLYNGNENTARKIVAKFKVDYPNTTTFIKYFEPEWKIQVGNYKTRLEADKALLVFQEKFSGAIVIPL